MGNIFVNSKSTDPAGVKYSFLFSTIPDIPLLDMEMEEKVKMVFNFTDEEIKRMLAVFKRLDKDRSGTISTAELFEQPYFKFNPLRERFIVFVMVSGNVSNS